MYQVVGFTKEKVVDMYIFKLSKLIILLSNEKNNYILNKKLINLIIITIIYIFNGNY